MAGDGGEGVGWGGAGKWEKVDKWACGLVRRAAALTNARASARGEPSKPTFFLKSWRTRRTT